MSLGKCPLGCFLPGLCQPSALESLAYTTQNKQPCSRTRHLQWFMLGPLGLWPRCLDSVTFFLPFNLYGLDTSQLFPLYSPLHM